MALFVIKSKKFGDVKVRVDDQDAYLLRIYVWTVSGRRGECVHRTGTGGVTETLGHVLMNAPSDHIVCFRKKDGEVLDYRRANLAVCATRADASAYRAEVNHGRFSQKQAA